MSEQPKRPSRVREKVMFTHANKYLTDEDDLEIRNITIAFKVIDDKCYYGVARTHPKDQFCKRTGREVAEAALNTSIAEDRNYFTVQDLITSWLESFINHWFRKDSPVANALNNITFDDLKVSMIVNHLHNMHQVSHRRHGLFS